MSIELVTLDEAKEHLIFEHDADDLRIADVVADASLLVLDYLKRTTKLIGYTDVNGVLLCNSIGELVTSLEPLVDSSGDLILDTDGAPVLPDWASPLSTPRINETLRRATLLVISTYDQRTQDDPISPAVESILRRLRDPALA